MSDTVIQEYVDKVRRHPRLVAADDFELFVQRIKGKRANYQSGVDAGESHEDTLWAHLRVLYRKQPGRSVSTYRTPSSIDQMVERALDAATQSSADPYFRYPIVRCQESLEETQEERFEDCGSLYEPGMAALKESVDSWSCETYFLRRSEKIEIGFRRNYHARETFLSLSKDAGLTEFALTKEEGAEDLKSLSAAHAHYVNATAHEISSSPMLLIKPAVMAQILRVISPWFCADLKYSDPSPFVKREGDLVFSKLITVLDQGDLPGGVHNVPFDVEGVSTSQTKLIEEGKVVDYLHDSYSAARENRASTGSFIRYPQQGEARIQPSHLFIQPGKMSEASLARQMGSGYVLEYPHSIELVPGSESEVFIQAAGFLVQNGERTQSFFPISLKCDLFELMMRAVNSSAGLSFHGHYGCPSILFENVPLNN